MLLYSRCCSFKKMKPHNFESNRMNKIFLRSLTIALLSTSYIIQAAESQKPEITKRCFTINGSTVTLVTGGNVLQPEGFVSKSQPLSLATPADGDLKKAGGFNGFVFSKAGEKDLAEECATAFENNGKKNYAVCSAVVTGSHGLSSQFQAIIHSVAPRVDKFENKDKADQALQNTYSAMISAAARTKTSIVTVPFGTGVAGYSHADSVRLLAGALKAQKDVNTNIHLIYAQEADFSTAVDTLVKETLDQLSLQ